MHFTLMLQHVANEAAIYRNPLIYNFRGDRKKTRPIINRPTLKYVMFLRKYKDKQFFVDTTFWQIACL